MQGGKKNERREGPDLAKAPHGRSVEDLKAARKAQRQTVERLIDDQGRGALSKTFMVWSRLPVELKAARDARHGDGEFDDEIAVRSFGYPDLLGVVRGSSTIEHFCAGGFWGPAFSCILCAGEFGGPAFASIQVAQVFLPCIVMCPMNAPPLLHCCEMLPTCC